MRILLFYDNLIRDFRGLLLLQELLRRRGHRVWVAPLWNDPQRAMVDINPHTIVMGQMGEQTTSDVGQFAITHGINVVLNTTENVCFEERKQYFFKVNFREWNEPYIDLQVIISRDFNAYIQNHTEIADKSKYRFIGCPRFDLSVHPQLCINETRHIREKYGLDRFRRKILYISSFIFDAAGGQASAENLEFINIPNRLKREMEQKAQHHDILTRLADTLAGENSVLLIKRHPWDKSTYYQDRYHDSRVILLDHHDYIVPLLQVSEAVIHTESTVAIEGWIQRKKTISLLPDFTGDRSRLKNHMRYEPIANSYDQLQALLSDYPWERTDQSLANYAPWVDGKATLRLAECIESLPVKASWRGFSQSAAARRCREQGKIEERLLTATQLRKLPTDSYDYHHRWLDQYRRQIQAAYREPIQRFAAEIRPAAPLHTDNRDGIDGTGSAAASTLPTIEDQIVLGNPAEAIKALTPILAAESPPGEAHFLMGRARMGVGDWPGAAQAFVSAVDLEPDRIDWRYILACLCVDRLSEPAAALAQCKAILAQRPDHVDSLWLLATICESTDQTARAADFVRAVLEIEPGHRKASEWMERFGTTSAATSPDSEYESIAADPDLANIRLRAEQQRIGRWRIHFRGLRIYCHDLASFYIAAKDIFLHRIYDINLSGEAPRIIDGGGHIGLFTLFIKQKYPNAGVIVFEPDADAVGLLKRNLAANKMIDVQVVAQGLFDRNGSMAFAPDGSDGGTVFSEHADGRVPVTRLTPYLDTPVDLLKLNIEGAEDAVIQDIAPHLASVRELVMEYHGFPEVGQTLHRILAILDGAGFRYLIHDFDAQTNPATKPPFQLTQESRFFLLIYAKQLPDECPAGRQEANGGTRGRQSIAQFYWGEFLRRHDDAIRGRVLIVGDPDPPLLSMIASAPAIDALICTPNGPADFSASDENTLWDCILFFQLPHSGETIDSLFPQAFGHLADGGTMLVWTSGIIPEKGSPHGGMTDRALELLMASACPEATVRMDRFGNLAAAKAWIAGWAADQLPESHLRRQDPDYPVVLGARLETPGAPAGAGVDSAIPEGRRLLVYTLWRSGTHWLANMVADLLQMRWEYSDGPDADSEIGAAIDAGLISVRHMETFPEDVMALADQMHFDVIFLCRDPRDVVASSVNMRKYVEGYRPGLPAFPDMPINGILRWDLAHYSKHYTDMLQAWIIMRHPRLHHVIYKDLVNDCVSTMTDVAHFLGIHEDAVRLNGIIEKYRFKNVSGRKKGQEHKTSLYRKGVVGDWPNQFDANGIALIQEVLGEHPFPPDPPETLSLSPVSRAFGFDRGQPIDRFFIDRFLNDYREVIHGRVLEIADNTYTRRFGDHVEQSDILHVVPAPNATIVGDLTTGENIPSGVFDCMILTQTLNVVFAVRDTLTHAYRALAPGGVLLITVPGISQVSRYDMDRWGDYWRFSEAGMAGLIKETLPDSTWNISGVGNREIASAFLDGQAVAEISDALLDRNDPQWAILLTAVVRKPKATGRASGRLHALQRIPPTVLLYHRIAREVTDPQLLAVDPDCFDAHLAHLADRYRVVPLAAMAEALSRGNLEPDTVALTFDDGYADNLSHAVPLLEKYGLHATVFIAAGPVDTGRPFWWDALAATLLGAAFLPDRLTLRNGVSDGEWPLGSPRQRLAAYHELCARLRGLPSEAIQAILSEIGLHLGQHAPAPTAAILNGDGVTQLAASSAIEIGAHTMTHPRLAGLSDTDQMTEIYLSKRRLEELSGKSVRLFSYPFGAPGDFDDTSVQAVKAAGYSAAVANIQGRVYKNAHLFAIPRLLVRNWAVDDFSQWLRSEDTGALEKQTVARRDRRVLEGMRMNAS